MKAHLVLSEVPLEFGFDLEALCGTTIFSAQIAYMWDSLSMGKFESPNTLLFCRKCTEIAVDSSLLGQRYLYGVVSAPEDS